MRTSIKLFLSIGALVCASIFPSAARADITGDTLNFSYYFPDPGTLLSDEGNFVANEFAFEIVNNTVARARPDNWGG